VRFGKKQNMRQRSVSSEEKDKPRNQKKKAKNGAAA
jgi:hypothetical protein